MQLVLRYFIKPVTLVGLLLFSAVSTFAGENSPKSYLVERMQITVEGIEQNSFDDLYKRYLNKQVSLEALSNELIEYFSDQDYLFPQITISEEKLKKGFLTAYVKLTSVNSIIIYDDEENKNPLMAEYIKQILASKPIKIKTFHKYLALMNRIPGYQVEYEFRPTENSGEVDLALLINKTKAEVYASSDSYGSSDYGQMQNLLSTQIFSPFCGNDSWTIYGITTNHPEYFYSLGTNYSRVVNNYGTSANIFAVTSRSNDTHDNIVTTKDGVDNAFGLFLNHPLYLDQNQSLEAEVGTTYRTSKGYTSDANLSSRPLIAKQKVRSLINIYSRLDTESRYSAANAALKYLLVDNSGGNNAINLTFIQGINGTFRNYTTPADIPDKHFNTTTLNFSRDQALPLNFSIYSHIMGGYADSNAPDQELFSLGGRDFGRGYESGILVGNKLLASSIELRYNKEMTDDPLFVLVQPYIFRDMGYVGKQDSDTNISHLNSYGAGIRFMLTHDAEIDIEVAEPVKKSYRIDGILYEAKTIFGIIATKAFRF